LDDHDPGELTNRRTDEPTDNGAMGSSAEVRVMLAPVSAYRALAGAVPRVRWPRALARPAIVALIIGSATVSASTARVTPGLVLDGAICWSFVPVLQIATAIALIGSVRGRTIEVPRAVDLLFAGHGPWSMWVLGVAVLQLTRTGSVNLILASTLVPAAWTAIIVFGFCVSVLETTRGGAFMRTAAHQMVTWIILASYVFAATQLWPRIIGSFER
jgi:hypothetical protein